LFGATCAVYRLRRATF